MTCWTLNLIGAGRLGQHWLAALAPLEQVTIQQVVSTHLTTQVSNNYAVIQDMTLLKPADITLLCVPDAQLASVAAKLEQHAYCSEQSIFAHCSGCYSSELLSGLAQKGAQIASMHPLKAFTWTINLHAFKDCHVSLEGDVLALTKLTALLQWLQAVPFQLDKRHKALYHSACTLASNGLVGMVHAASTAMAHCGLDASMSQAIVLSMVSASLKNCQNSPSLPAALTGPLVRNDRQTIHQHLKVLVDSPDIQALYIQLSEQLLSLTAQSMPLSDWLNES